MNNTLVEQIEKIRENIHGWCTLEKSLKISEIILERKPNLCVEIGVFGGASLLPQALSLKHNKKGIIIGIDPWENEAALESMQEEANIEWWSKVDFNMVYEHCLNKIKEHNLEEFCKLIKDKSENVCKRFKNNSIDILHIDGNHSEDVAYKDSLLYLNKVKSKGIILFDDIYWTEKEINTTNKAISFLLESCKRIETIEDCLILEKN